MPTKTVNKPSMIRIHRHVPVKCELAAMKIVLKIVLNVVHTNIATLVDG